MRNFHSIKPQDILITLKLISAPKSSQKDLSLALQISQAEISHGLQRLKFSRLINLDSEINAEACLEFLIHGLKYVYPAVLGPQSAGIPTAHTKPGFNFVKHRSEDTYVWPHPSGKIKGASILPFYPTLPDACLQDNKLYMLAALVEMIRSGRAREQKIAAEELKKIMKKLL
jgi:hypothetical protein